MQQDAEECLNCLLAAVSASLDSKAAEETAKTLPYMPKNAKDASALDLLFGVQLEVTTKRSELVEDAEAKTTMQVERHRKLTCFLGTPQKPVNTLEDGLKFSLGDEVVKVGSDAADAGNENTLIRSNRVGSLALYLIIHFMRFEWKTGGNEADKAKICRSIKFAPTLDMYQHCTKVCLLVPKNGS